MNRAILWDFDGTLASRDGGWTDALLEALNRRVPEHGLTREEIRSRTRHGFPWHTPETPHTHLNRPERWWEHVCGQLARVFRDLGLEDRRAETLARATRVIYTDATSFRLYEDTVHALQALREAGWRHVILSNHVPELPNLVRELGVLPLFDDVISSALIGYEKPHPEAFAIALRAAGDPDEAWMVGDNPVNDVQGAEAAGLPAILVRREGEARHRCEDLQGVVQILTQV